MGNQLAGIAPSQIFPVEHYLTDLPEYQFDVSLGSTRFLKVARAKFREGLVVVKVFAIQDPSLPLRVYKDQLEDIKRTLSTVSNALPFQKFMLTEKAALLFRQYVKYNLYDRVSTRPFLNNIEKKWIAFQIIYGLSQCHKLGVCHGDIKLENIMVTGWNWVLLTDFASIKPTYLPEDNPADFSYFFDTSRRRTCYTAPERFVKTLNPDALGSNLLLPDDEIKKGDLMPSMDIFSLGCVLTELFTEGHAPFDLVQLLAYRNGEYSPWKILERIEDTGIREMLRHMMQKDPQLRFPAERYLENQRGKVFPEYFYSFLRNYMDGFAHHLGQPIASPDDKILSLSRDLPNMIKLLCSEENSKESAVDIDAPSEGLVIVVTLITSCLRALKYCTAKLQALEMLVMMAPHLSADIILDRLTPYMLVLVSDIYPRVRVAALRALTSCLTLVKTVPRSDAHVFPEYILPNLAELSHDDAVIVRIAFAENIALLAETALRFLEMTQLDSNSHQADTTEDSNTNYQASYDAELQALHEMIQQRVRTLLSDPDNIIKQTLMENGITRLCVFFGHQKANDVLLSHMITFLNDKEDRHLRGAFFDCIVGVAAYVGWQSSPIMKPLLQQGLSDTEEFVIEKALNAMANLTELGLLQKTTLYELLAETAPFLSHPNLWIRHGTVGFICAVARNLNIADVHCKLLPVILPFLKQPIIQVDKEVILLSVLKEPVPRAVYDSIIRSPYVIGLLDCLQNRQLLRGIARSGHPPNYGEFDPTVKALHRRLVSDGMTESVEEKLIMMRDCLLKVFRYRSSLESKQSQEKEKDGCVNLSHFQNVARRETELIGERNALASGSAPGQAQLQAGLRTNRKKPLATAPSLGLGAETTAVIMNEEWQHMFGTTAPEGRSQSPRPLPEKKGVSDAAALMTQSLPQSPGHFESRGSSGSGEGSNASAMTPISMSQLQRGDMPPSPRRIPLTSDAVTLNPIQKTQYSVAPCYKELRELVYNKVEEKRMEYTSKDSTDVGVWDAKFPQPSWKPKGLLVAHLHEHRSVVNRIVVIPESSLFATCSNDGTVKIWDCGRMEGKSVANRARQTYNRQEGQITALAVCQNHQAIASASDNCTIHVFRYEYNNPKVSMIDTRTLDAQEEGCVVDMTYFDSGSQSVLTYATVYGSIIGWDLRSPGTAWKLENDPRHGLITSYCIDPRQSWLVVGTSSGKHVCWDIRFQLPISCHAHPTGARVRRLVLHPRQHSWVISAVQGNNEVSMWDMETGARQVTLWASAAPALSQTQASNHASHALQVWPGEDSLYLLTAGSDMRIRYWDLHTPANSYIVVGAANDVINPSFVSYSSRLVDGTEVVLEMHNKPRGQGIEDMPRRGPDTPPSGHHDCISDLAICQTSQTLVISGSKNGVVKVWK